MPESFQVFVISKSTTVPPNELLYLKSGAVCGTIQSSFNLILTVSRSNIYRNLLKRENLQIKQIEQIF